MASYNDPRVNIYDESLSFLIQVVNLIFLLKKICSKLQQIQENPILKNDLKNINNLHNLTFHLFHRKNKKMKIMSKESKQLEKKKLLKLAISHHHSLNNQVESIILNKESKDLKLIWKQSILIFQNSNIQKEKKLNNKNR